MHLVLCAILVLFFTPTHTFAQCYGGRTSSISSGSSSTIGAIYANNAYDCRYSSDLAISGLCVSSTDGSTLDVRITVGGSGNDVLSGGTSYSSLTVVPSRGYSSAAVAVTCRNRIFSCPIRFNLGSATCPPTPTPTHSPYNPNPTPTPVPSRSSSSSSESSPWWQTLLIVLLCAIIVPIKCYIIYHRFKRCFECCCPPSNYVLPYNEPHIRKLEKIATAATKVGEIVNNVELYDY